MNTGVEECSRWRKRYGGYGPDMLRDSLNAFTWGGVLIYPFYSSVADLLDDGGSELEASMGEACEG